MFVLLVVIVILLGVLSVFSMVKSRKKEDAFSTGDSGSFRSSVNEYVLLLIASHQGLSFTGSVEIFMNIDIIAPSASCAVMFSMLSPVLFCCSFVQWSSAVLMLQFVPVALLSPNTVSMP